MRRGIFTYLHRPSLNQARSRHRTHTRSRRGRWCTCRCRRGCRRCTRWCLWNSYTNTAHASLICGLLSLGMWRRRSKALAELAFTSDTSDVQLVAHGTFTPERAVCVDALAIYARVIQALIHICKRKSTGRWFTTRHRSRAGRIRC